ncbi:MAG: type II toxin-antitoxin system PemK/MazF family toxin [Betaproteobacteria bacterium]|nr:type II toxin-antitoxin system PemK/MazF family toxin [Betaproteobacteria bacterium]
MVSSKFQRGQIWEVDLEPQSHKEEPGKRRRPALVVQTDLLNNSGHPTTMVVVGTSQTRRDKDYFPLRVALTSQAGLPLETDLLIDQVRAVSNRRFMGDEPLTTLNTAQLKRVEDALKLLIGR